MSDKEKGGLVLAFDEDEFVGEYWPSEFGVAESHDQADGAEQSQSRGMDHDPSDETEPENGTDALEQDAAEEPQAEEPEQDEEPEEESADKKKKIKFNAKPLRDHGHMRHGPFQGGDVGEEAGALACNFIWSLSKGGGRRLGGLIAAVPKYGASHLASYLKSALKEKLGRGAGAEEPAGGAFVAEEGDRIAQTEDFVKLNIDPVAVERFNAALADRNIDSLQIANPDGSMKFIIRAQDVDAVNQALDDIIGVPDRQIDEQHAVMEQAQSFAKENERAATAQPSQEAAVDASVLGDLAEEGATLDQQIGDAKKDAAQRGEERRQEQSQKREANRKQNRDSSDRGLGKQRERSSGPDR